MSRNRNESSIKDLFAFLLLLSYLARVIVAVIYSALRERVKVRSSLVTGMQLSPRHSAMVKSLC
jgi:hypothetical protein